LLLELSNNKLNHLVNKDMILGIDFGTSNINYVVFNNDVLKTLTDTSVNVVVTQGNVPVGGDLLKAFDVLIDKIETCNISQIGINKSIGSLRINHNKNIEKLRNARYYDYDNIIDIGNKTTKVVIFNGATISNTFNNGKCAAGSGSFLESMAVRLGYDNIEAFTEAAYNSNEPAHLSGRCAVFTESDIVHLFQKGVTREKIASGICKSIALNIKTMLGNKKLSGKTLFIGGVSKNKAVMKYLKEVFKTDNIYTEKIPFNAFATIFTPFELNKAKLKDILKNEYITNSPIKENGSDSAKDTDKVFEEFIANRPIKIKKSKIVTPKEVDIKDREFNNASLGVDIGSVSTKAALITMDSEGKPLCISHYYRKTLGNPLVAVKDVITKISEDLEKRNIKIKNISAGTTGSGRYLTADFIGADLTKNEITSQAAGSYVFNPDVDTIFEIGGQDSKYILLDGNNVVDFEMNRVCAAGTGAFLEKQASTLGIDIKDFGGIALRNTNPPDFDHNCTVFTEMSLKEALNRGVNIKDLAAGLCIASTKNFINKNVANRKIGNKIAFCGAVAFNKGMVAAFESLLDREIFVSEYPHITGAIGIAYLTYKHTFIHSNLVSKFKGFERIKDIEYNLTSFRCDGCDNICDVSVFEIDNVKHYYNDRCEKFSDHIKSSYQINLFDKHKELIEQTNTRVPQLATQKKTIGYPQGMLYDEYYPLFGAFFVASGFNVVVSDDTNKSIIKNALEIANNKPCFPFKVAHGHVDNILKKNVDLVFLPRIIDGERTNKHIKNTHNCPYIQSSADVIVSALELKGLQNNLDRPFEETDKIISPTFYMSYEMKDVKKELIKMGEFLGVKSDVSKRAADIAFDCLLDFRDELSDIGRNTLELYKDYIYVIIGHPYVLYDNILNMNIGKKIADLGYMAIPQDFLVDKRDISGKWHVFQKEVQKKLEIADILKGHPEVKTIIMSYYACGSDAFANRFYKEELGLPCYVMNLDEHTADAGVMTRLEAFADTKLVEKNSSISKVKILELNKVKGKKVWIPNASRASELLAKALCLYGIKAEVIEESVDTNFNLARKEISEDVCLPCLATTEDMLYRASQEDFDPEKEAFFQASANGPCRLGMYAQLQKIILNKKGNVPVTCIDNNFFRSTLSIDFALLAWQAMLVHDILFKLLLHSRPYEINVGDADRIYNKYTDLLLYSMSYAKKHIRKKKFNDNDTSVPMFKDCIKEATEEFIAFTNHSIKKPVIGIVGEFYLKLNDRSNKYIIKYLEDNGFEVWMSTLSEFFHYTNYISLNIVQQKLNNKIKISMWDKSTRDLLKERLIREFSEKWIHKTEESLVSMTLPYLDDFVDANSEGIVELGKKYINPAFGGEAICSMGKAGDFFSKNVTGIINISPFNCIPGNIVASLVDTFKTDHENIPFLCLNYDGFEDNYEEINDFISNLM